LISPEALAFAQRSQALALPWAVSGRTDFDCVRAVAALATWIETVPPGATAA
jgi:hypothetical protein